MSCLTYLSMEALQTDGVIAVDQSFGGVVGGVGQLAFGTGRIRHLGPLWLTAIYNSHIYWLA
jgi:hypothetical protein